MSDFMKGFSIALVAIIVIGGIALIISRSVVYSNNLANERMANCVASNNTYGSCYSNIINGAQYGQFSKN